MLYRFDNREPTVGTESYVSETAVLVGDVRVGNNCYIGHGAVLRGDYGTIEIGDGTAIEEGVVIHAPPDQKCSIGEKVTVGHGAIIHAKSISNFAVIGMGAVVSINSEVGERSIVAEGSVVRKGHQLPDGMVIGGNPAQPIREISPANADFAARGKQLYIDLAKKYLAIGMHRLD